VTANGFEGWGFQLRSQHPFLQAIYAAGLFSRVEPVPGAQDGCKTLKDLGYRRVQPYRTFQTSSNDHNVRHRLIIVTARSEETRRAETEEWIDRYFPEVFDEIWFSGEFVAIQKSLSGSTPAIKCGSTKSEVGLAEFIYRLQLRLNPHIVIFRLYGT
jgi:hypothetical protein